jgi:PEP-CTERM motif-containing protein
MRIGLLRTIVSVAGLWGACFFPAFASVSPLDYFSMATAEAPAEYIPGGYDYISAIAGISTGKVADPVANIINPVTSYLDPMQTAQSGSGLSAATADRSTGELHAQAGVLGGYEFAATASASFGDILAFVNSTASATTVTTISFNLHVDGDLSDFPPGDGYTSSGNASGSILLVVGNDKYSGGPFAGFEPTTANIVMTGTIVDNYYGGPNTVDKDYTGTFSFIGPSASAMFYFSLVAGGQYQYADFSNTAIFSFDSLPIGVSYTSASGDFLIPVTGSIPEPSIWAMLMLGFTGLGIAGFRRAAAAAA